MPCATISTAAIVLAGGRSSRMGQPKAWLEWHGSTLLRRVTGLVAREVEGPVVVVRAPGQDLPGLAAGVEVVDDAREGRGPLQGILAGMEALDGRAQVAYVQSVDAPLLHPAFVRAVLGRLDADVDVVLPVAGGHRHPLAAAYRMALLPSVAGLVAEDRMKPAFLFDTARVTRLDDADLLADPGLRAADPRLASLTNLNEPADYDAARSLPAPEITVARFGALRGTGPRGPTTVRAATLGAAAAAAGLALDEHVVAALNGDQISRDAEVPLATGDTVAFIAADAGG